MKHYVVTQKVTLQAGEKEFRKDQTITATDVGQANLDRYLKKGYIRLLGEDTAKSPSASPPATADSSLPFYMTTEGFLTPEQVDKLTKPQLVDYAGRIALIGFKPNISAGDLKKLINQFIEDAAESDDDDEGEDDESGTVDDTDDSVKEK